MTNRKTTKRALFTSTLALLMCVAMLIGTTFAWFTDTASTNVNKVQAGTLKVDLEMLNADNKWETAVGKTLDFIKAVDAPEDEAILWEPGCTYALPTIRVVNNGNLALKYKVVVSAVTGDDNLAGVLDVLYTDTTLKCTDENVGTLAAILTSTDPDGFAYGKLAAKNDASNNDKSGEITLKLHMKESAGNEYQGKTINGIAVTVLATQDTVEYDSTTNQYDKDAVYVVGSVNDLTALAEQVKAGTFGNGIVKLTADLDLTGVEWTPIGNSKDTPFSGIFDGNNKTITGLSGNMGLFGWITGGTVMNLTISEATINNSVADLHGTGILAGRIRHGGTIDGVTVSGSVTSSSYYTGGLIGAITGSSSVTVIKNCTNNANVTSTSHQAGGIAGYAQCNTTISNCTNTGAVSESSGYGAGGIVGFMSGCGNDQKAPTIENCTNSGAITSAGTLAKAGGIAGAFGAEGGQGPFTLEANINSCTNTGTVNGTSVTTDDKAYYCGGKVNYNGADTSTLTLKVDGTALNY